MSFDMEFFKTKIYIKVYVTPLGTTFWVYKIDLLVN